MSDVALPALFLAAFGFFFAGLVKGGTGLGFSTTCLPFLVLALGIDRALPLVLVPSLTSNMLVHVQAGQFRRTLATFWPMFLALLPGLFLGLWLLTRVDLGFASAVLGVVLVIYGAWTLGHIDAALPPGLVGILRLPVGFMTGLVNGLTGSQIMPVLPYLLSQPLDRDVFLQAVNISFTISSLVMAFGLSKIGFLTPELALYSFGSLIPVFLGVAIGTAIRKRMTTDTFRKVVLLVLIGLGLSLILRNII